MWRLCLCWRYPKMMNSLQSSGTWDWAFLLTPSLNGTIDLHWTQLFLCHRRRNTEMLSVNGPLGLAPRGNAGSTTANVIYTFTLFLTESGSVCIWSLSLNGWMAIWRQNSHHITIWQFDRLFLNGQMAIRWLFLSPNCHSDSNVNGTWGIQNAHCNCIEVCARHQQWVTWTKLVDYARTEVQETNSSLT